MKEAKDHVTDDEYKDFKSITAIMSSLGKSCRAEKKHPNVNCRKAVGGKRGFGGKVDVDFLFKAAHVTTPRDVLTLFKNKTIREHLKTYEGIYSAQGLMHLRHLLKRENYSSKTNEYKAWKRYCKEYLNKGIPLSRAVRAYYEQHSRGIYDP